MSEGDRRYLHVAALAALLAALCLMLAGCTYVKKGDLTYLSVLQRKSAVVETDGKKIKARYNTDSDAAVELARQNMELTERLLKASAGAP